MPHPLPERCRAVRSAIALAALLVAVQASAAAQHAERPLIVVGDRWQFVEYLSVPSQVPNREWIVTAVTPAAVEGTENGAPLRLTPDLGVLDSPRNTQSNPRPLDFPLEVGKRWRFETDWLFRPTGSQGRAVVDVHVAAHEPVDVPAGRFDAFKLVSTSAMRGRSPKGSLIDAPVGATYWYAPAARTIVKSVTRNPYIGVTTVELVAYRPQAAGLYRYDTSLQRCVDERGEPGLNAVTRNNAGGECSDFSGRVIVYLGGEGRSFRGADFTRASFKYLNLMVGADLTGASLREVDGDMLDLSDANLAGADLTGARLAGCVPPQRGTCLKGARFDGRTKLPFPRAEALARGMVEIANP